MFRPSQGDVDGSGGREFLEGPGEDELAPDPQHIDSLIAEGDLVAAHLRAGLEVTHLRIYRIVADRIAEVWGA